MANKFLDTEAVAKLYDTSPGAIRTALWRYRKHGIHPGMPLPVLIRGKQRWVKSAIDAHLDRADAVSAGKDAKARRPKR